jgi:hypothetical protein
VWHWLCQCPLLTMLIDHDFDWEADLEDSPRPGVAPASENAPGPAPPLRRPGGHIRPGEQVVIIERHRGLSRSTLILALVALALSVALAISKAPRQNAAVTKTPPQTQRGRTSPARSDRPAAQPDDPPRRR